VTLSKSRVGVIVDVYIRAWTQQDPDLIVTIFTETATYHERVLEDPSGPARGSVTTGRGRWSSLRRGSPAPYSTRMLTEKPP
jgi:hypothetical protein